MPDLTYLREIKTSNYHTDLDRCIFWGQREEEEELCCHLEEVSVIFLGVKIVGPFVSRKSP